MKVLIIIDCQEDFFRGTLANEKAVKIIPNLKNRIEKAKENKEMVIFTMDTHYENYLNTLEGKKLPIKHCIYGTDGWNIISELENNSKTHIKNTFGSLDLVYKLQSYISTIEEDVEFEVCGVVSSICVLANAVLLRAAFPNSKISVNPNLIADISEENQQAAILCLKAQQIDIIEEEN